MTAVASTWMSLWQLQVQLAVVEAGLGGVADATNVFEPAQLACAVITAIDNDHMKALGTP